MRYRTVIFILTGIFMMLSLSVFADKVYRWVDEKGSVHFSEMPPANTEKQNFEEYSLKKRQKLGNENCCHEVKRMAVKMILAQNRGATISDLYAFDHPDLGSLKELANFVAQRFSHKMKPLTIVQLAYDTCMNGGFNLCVDPQQASPTITGVASGSGFFVSEQGHILTNAHVVKQCKKITIYPAKKAARVVAQDTDNDLALLQTSLKPDAVAAFSDRAVQLGEEVTVAGYPYRGEISSSLNVTQGSVSNLAGIKNDQRLIQISAPVQAGNSGGPLIDKRGAIVGVVVSKLNALYFAEKYRDIPQNMNYAIRAELARNFLQNNGIRLTIGKTDEELAPTVISQQAQSYTISIECSLLPDL